MRSNSVFTATESVNNTETVRKTYNLSAYGITEVKSIYLYDYYLYSSYTRFDVDNGSGGYTSKVVYVNNGQYGHASWNLSGNTLTIEIGGWGGSAPTNYHDVFVAVTG